MPPDQFAGALDLQTDLATILARLVQLDQLRADTGAFDLPEFIWRRIMTCDVPRLRAHLGPEALRILDQLEAGG